MVPKWILEISPTRLLHRDAELSDIHLALDLPFKNGTALELSSWSFIPLMIFILV